MTCQREFKFIYLSLVWSISRAELLHCADMSSVLQGQPVQQTEPSAGSQRHYSWAWWAPCSWPWWCDKDTLRNHEAFEVYFAEFWLIDGKLRKCPLQIFIGFSFCIENRNLQMGLDVKHGMLSHKPYREEEMLPNINWSNLHFPPSTAQGVDSFPANRKHLFVSEYLTWIFWLQILATVWFCTNIQNINISNYGIPIAWSQMSHNNHPTRASDVDI